MDSDHTKLSVGGYLFFTEKDAGMARMEEQKIEYLEARMDYSSPEGIRYVYEKAIHERLFRTPVGFAYLEKLREYLLNQPEIEPGDVMEIPLYISFDSELRDHTSPARQRVVPSQKKDKEKNKFTLSVILNVLLVCAIISMFYISFVSEQPNIINYERAIVSKYASWEQDLTEREQVIREKERELKINQE